MYRGSRRMRIGSYVSFSLSYVALAFSPAPRRHSHIDEEIAMASG